MVSIKQLLESGVHFGHQTRRWNPKMAQYIFGERNGIYIVNLEKTEKELQKACDFMRKIAAEGEYVLFVGTKKQAQQAIMEETTRCGMYYVNQRWLGGTLTNFDTIRKSVKRLNELERMSTDGTFAKLKKKEVSMLNKEMGKLLKNLSGIRKMNKLPGVLFVVDVKKEETAVKEARRLKIPVVALVDTNSDPDMIDYVIPGNDDALKSIKVICAAIADAVCEGSSVNEKNSSDQKERKETGSSQPAKAKDMQAAEGGEEIPVIKAEGTEESIEKAKKKSVKLKRKA
ncbi:MAG: 30S ribosomal protein S2 [Candidatus Omnitrophica bacterium]|nr:30S ribosomal protein S2 [Candidatus Omnitrophota bacterium]